jgi:Ca-activated chloride channel homolog
MKAPTITSNPTDFGLLAWLGKTRIQLPLRDIDCRFQVSGDIATVDLLQVFEQTAGQPLDVTYSFPLPAGAAVHRCEFEVNGRVIKAVVMEENEARKTAVEHKAQGHRTALVEVERENLFTLSLGNVAPGDKLVIRFGYLQALERLGAQLSLRIPVCPGIRYIPGQPLLRSNRGAGASDDTDQVPDASRLSPPRMGADHLDAACLYVEGRIASADVDLSTASSPSHSVVLRPEGEQICVRLTEGKPVPDRDFVMRWDEPKTSQAVARSWVTRHETGLHVLLQLRAPQQLAAHDAWEQDVYFLLDRSGSMEGGKWEQCAHALHAFVRELGTEDRIWITCFESTFADFSDEPMARDAMLADAEFLNISKLGTAGGTELLPALDHILKQVSLFSAARRARIIIITDGQVGNESEILKAMRAHPKLPVYCFGIDTAVNDACLRSLAEQQNGRCTLMTPSDDIAAAVSSLAQSLRRPVLTSLELGDGLEQANGQRQLPDLHAGEVALVPTRLTNSSTRAFIRGKLADGSPWSHEFDLSQADNLPAPELLWARERIQHLLRSGEARQAVALAIQHNLICKGAAFIAWDDSEKVTIAKREVYQPALMAARHGAADQILSDPYAGISFCLMRYDSDEDDELAAIPSQALASTPLSSLIRKLSQRYVDEPDMVHWANWKTAFEACLQDQGRIKHELLAPIARLLGAWVAGLLGLGRLRKLDALLPEIREASDPLDVLSAFFKKHLRKEFLADAEMWLSLAKSSTNGSGRSDPSESSAAL